MKLGALSGYKIQPIGERFPNRDALYFTDYINITYLIVGFLNLMPAYMLYISSALQLLRSPFPIDFGAPNAFNQLIRSVHAREVILVSPSDYE